MTAVQRSGPFIRHRRASGAAVTLAALATVAVQAGLARAEPGPGLPATPAGVGAPALPVQPRSALATLQPQNALLPQEPLPDPGSTTVIRKRDAGRPHLELDLARDLSIIATGLMITAAAQPLDVRAPGALPRIAPAASVNAMDRGVIGNRSPTADRLSDLLLSTAVIAPHLAGLLELTVQRDSRTAAAVARDSVVILETLAVTGMMTNLVKFGVGRARPYAYSEPAGSDLMQQREATLSFFSGHTSMAFAMATSYSYLYSQRHPESAAKIPIWIGTHTLAAATGALRVMGGKHFWSDVLVGAAVGSGIGFLVPFLHRPRGEHGSLLARLGDVRLTPFVSGGGYGASLTFVF